MAARPTILFIGDQSAAGTLPVASLAAINPTYDDVQTDMFIWAPTPGAWQQMQPGVNTDPTGASDRWSLESRFREAIRPNKPTGNYYAIKHAADSTLIPTSAKPSWSQLITGQMFSQLIAQITNAAAAANAAGDTLSIQGIVLSLFTDDYKLSWGHRSYAANLFALISAIRDAIPGIPYCAAGSLNGADSIPVAVVEPPYKVTGLSETNQFFLTLSRGGLEATEQEAIYNTYILHSASRTLAGDNKTFSAQSMVDLSAALGSTFFPTTITYTGPDAPLALILGDSINEGTGTNSQLPAHLQGVQTGVNIFNCRTGAIEALQAGVNNQITLDPLYGFHGIEVPLGQHLRGVLNEVWFLKATSIGSLSVMWSPISERYFWNSMVRPWLVNMAAQIKAAGKRPAPKLVSICLGTNDIRNATANIGVFQSTMEAVIDNTLFLFTSLGMATTDVKFCLALPAESVSADLGRVAAVRDALVEIAQTYPGVFVVDLNPFSTLDGVHPDTAGTLGYARAIYDGFAGTANISLVSPLFAPSALELKRALRLSQVPDSNDAASMINAAIQTVRTRFFQHLGDVRVKQLASMPYLPNATTAAEQMRALAFQTEIKWVRYELLRTMPTLFMDGTSRVQAWNDEAAFRETSYLSSRDEMKRLESEIFEALGTLKSATLSVDGRISMSTIGPANPIIPGDTVFKVI